MKRLLDTLIAHWKMVVSMGDYALSLDRKKEAPRPRQTAAKTTSVGSLLASASNRRPICDNLSE